MRLIEGPLYGHVEICINHVWGVVCNRLWDAVDAAVVCRQLGLPSEGMVASLSSTAIVVVIIVVAIFAFTNL